MIPASLKDGRLGEASASLTCASFSIPFFHLVHSSRTMPRREATSSNSLRSAPVLNCQYTPKLIQSDQQLYEPVPGNVRRSMDATEIDLHAPKKAVNSILDHIIQDLGIDRVPIDQNEDYYWECPAHSSYQSDRPND